MPEFWAHCAVCDRWFYVAWGELTRLARSTECLVCGAAPESYEVRYGDLRFAVRLDDETFMVDLGDAAPASPR